MDKPTALVFLSLVALAVAAKVQTAESAPAPPVVLTDGRGRYPLGLHLDILEDPGGELTIEDIASPEFEARFTPSLVEVPNFGYTDSAYWVRLQVRNEARTNNLWLLEVGFANMFFVDLYTPLPPGAGFAVKQTGALRPLATRDLLHPHIVLNLEIPTRSEQTVYLRLQNGASMTLPLILWSPAAFSNKIILEQVPRGLFFGALLSLLAYNLFLLVSLREASFLYLVIFLASAILFEAGYAGYIDTYLFPGLFRLKIYYHSLPFTVMVASMVLFTNAYLELKARLLNLYRANLAILAVWLGLESLSLIVSYRLLASLLVSWALVSLAAVLAAGIISLRHKYRPARFFLVSWLGLIAGFIVGLLVRLGWTSSTAITENVYHLGIIWMAVCWSIALVDRINLLKADAESANRSLGSSEHRLSQILGGLPVGVVLYGKDQKPQYVNQRAADIFSNPAQDNRVDLSFQHTLEQAIQYFALKVGDSDQEYPVENFPVYRALHGEPAAADDIEADQVDRRLPLEIRASPVYDDRGEVESAVAAFQDITPRKQVEAELARHRQNLEELVEERTTALSAVNDQLQREAADRSRLEESLTQRISWLSSLHEINSEVSGAADLPPVYEKLVDAIFELLGARMVFLYRWDNQSGQSSLIERSTTGDPTLVLDAFRNAFQLSSPLRRQLKLKRTVLLSPGPESTFPEPFRRYSQEGGNGSLVLAQMVAREQSFGALGVMAPEAEEDFDQMQVDLIGQMALDLADLTLEASYLDQALTLAATDERQRLARDLHDSVTQTLFTASVLTEATPRLWERDPAIARANMEKLSVLIRGALAEMRSLLLELRSTQFDRHDLSQLLTTLAEAARVRSRAEIALTINGVPELPKNVTEAFYRIAREALNNVIAHAQATRVEFSLAEEGGRAVLRIRDNGRGFDPLSIQSGHLGITIMNERAAQIGGDLEVRSQPGLVTEISLTWPGLEGAGEHG